MANEIIRKKDDEICYYKESLLRKMNEENYELNKRNRELHMQLEVITHKLNDQEISLREIKQNNSFIHEKMNEKEQ